MDNQILLHQIQGRDANAKFPMHCDKPAHVLSLKILAEGTAKTNVTNTVDDDPILTIIHHKKKKKIPAKYCNGAERLQGGRPPIILGGLHP